MTGATGVLYDPLFLEHDLPGHPESATRLQRIVAELVNVGVWQRMQPVTPRPIDSTLLERVHDRDYVNKVR